MAGKRSGIKYLVLDINGIVADIRRREAGAVNRIPDIVLPNGHKVYLHPHAGKFLQWASDLGGVKVITYTSRLKHNAEPVETLLDYYRNEHGGKAHNPIARLYGEDCKPAGTHREDPYHPVKTVGAVVRAISLLADDPKIRPVLHAPHHPEIPLHALHHPEVPLHSKGLLHHQIVDERDIIFVDDHPKRIESGRARVVEAGRYDAAIPDTEKYLADTVWKISDAIAS